jgi:hypothetical protein
LQIKTLNSLTLDTKISEENAIPSSRSNTDPEGILLIYPRGNFTCLTPMIHHVLPLNQTTENIHTAAML